MPDLRIKQSQIDALAGKLDEVADVLTQDERTLLLAVFKLASATLSGSAAGGGGQTESGQITARRASSALPSLSSGFRSAFQPVLGGGLNPAGLDIDVHIGW